MTDSFFNQDIKMINRIRIRNRVSSLVFTLLAMTCFFLGGISGIVNAQDEACLLYTSPSPRDGLLSRMPSSA